MVQKRSVLVERKLSAVMAADVAGYSRLMHDDEEATHARLTALLTDVVDPAIAEHGGRIVKHTGDGFLAEFPSAVEALRAATYFQNTIRDLTSHDAERRLVFRVGINIGDVIVEPHEVLTVTSACLCCGRELFHLLPSRDTERGHQAVFCLAGA